MKIIHEDGYDIIYAYDNPELVESMRGIENNNPITVLLDEHECNFMNCGAVTAKDLEANDIKYWVKEFTDCYMDSDNIGTMLYLSLHAVVVSPPTVRPFKVRQIQVVGKFGNIRELGCQVCGEGNLTPRRELREITFEGRTEMIPLYFSSCDTCGGDFSNAHEMKLNKQAVVKFKNWPEDV